MVDTPPIPEALVVCTDPHKHSAIKRALKGAFQVIEAYDSLSAADWIRAIQFDVVIIDQKSSENTWSILSEYIRQQSNYSQVPILLITSNHKKNFFVNALNHGISAFINEPLDTREIYQRVINAIQTKPVNKKVALVTHKIKKSLTTQPMQDILHHRVITTKETIEALIKLNKTQRPLCLIMLEIDHFNKMEEDFSKEDVKELLESVHRFLKKFLRKLDALFPQGTGRFLIVLPKTSQRAGVVIAETIRSEAHATQFIGSSLTLSIGLIAYDEKLPLNEGTFDKLEELLKKVDTALKEAKQKGNRTITH